MKIKMLESIVSGKREESGVLMNKELYKMVLESRRRGDLMMRMLELMHVSDNREKSCVLIKANKSD